MTSIIEHELGEESLKVAYFRHRDMLERLPLEFTVSEAAKRLGMNPRVLGARIRRLCWLGLVEKSKRGRRVVWRKVYAD